jgi:deoxyribodipyrimidine photo-lyase
MSKVIYWFRNDLRLADNAAWLAAHMGDADVLPVYVHDAEEIAKTRWGFARVCLHRRTFNHQVVASLADSLTRAGSALAELHGNVAPQLIGFAKTHGASRIVCEEIAAPEEQAVIDALGSSGLDVEAHWQSSLLAPSALPFAVAKLPGSFTTFRKRVESAAQSPVTPALPNAVGAVPAHCIELAAQQEIAAYFNGGFAQTYKITRDKLFGEHVSSRWSKWLALGVISPGYLYRVLKQHEATCGANESTYWLWLELLWRDYFRFLHMQYGVRLYHARGLSDAPLGPHNSRGFVRWCEGTTGQPLVDAGMRELAATGYLSNRMRQIVASYLIYELHGDYRAGAAWFEHQLIDYDPYSNQGNWLYIAGRGTDPRGGRKFDVDWQTRQHDPAGEYQRMWGHLR